MHAMKMPRNKKLIVYELLMAFLALIVVAILFIEFTRPLTENQEKILTRIDLAILAIFAIDYFYRLIKSRKKWAFIKSNIFDLVAILPFDKAFRIARLARLIRLVRFTRATRVLRLSKLARLALFVRKLGVGFKGVLVTNGLIYAIGITVFIILGGAFGILALEPSMNTFGDALWWSMVTTTTVGYGDISPESPGGRILATVLMIVGIGFLGMVTGSIATYFVDKISKKAPPQSVYEERLDLIKRKLDNIESLTHEDIISLNKAIVGIWVEKKQAEPEKFLTSKKLEVS